MKPLSWVGMLQMSMHFSIIYYLFCFLFTTFSNSSSIPHAIFMMLFIANYIVISSRMKIRLRRSIDCFHNCWFKMTYSNTRLCIFHTPIIIIHFSNWNFSMICVACCCCAMLLRRIQSNCISLKNLQMYFFILWKMLTLKPFELWISLSSLHSFMRGASMAFINISNFFAQNLLFGDVFRTYVKFVTIDRVLSFSVHIYPIMIGIG